LSITILVTVCVLFFFSSRRRHTRFSRDWSSDVCSSDLLFGHLVLADRNVVLSVPPRARGGGLLFPRGIDTPRGESVPLLTGNHRSEEHTSELQSRENLVCRLLLEKNKPMRLTIWILATA